VPWEYVKISQDCFLPIHTDLSFIWRKNHMNRHPIFYVYNLQLPFSVSWEICNISVQNLLSKIWKHRHYPVSHHIIETLCPGSLGSMFIFKV
jgi:hypothetical protein